VAHIPDGFLSAPVLAGTAVLSVGVLTVATRRSRDRLGEREAPVLGAMTAFVFAAQMLNFPIGAGTSAHLLGGVLVTVLVGPWSGMLVLFSVLLVQALLFQDGGIAALGANTLNIAVLGGGVGYVVYRWVFALVGPGSRRMIAAAAVAGYVSLALVGMAASVELVLSGTVPLMPALVAVGGGHLVVGLGEAILTAGILLLVSRTRPQLVEAIPAPSPVQRRFAYTVALGSLIVASVGGYAASSRPDALEAAASKLGLSERVSSWLSSPFAEYSAPVGGQVAAGVVGVTAVFVLAWGLTRLAAKGRNGA
jgi:cobalt/nickel transport system permease protein